MPLPWRSCIVNKKEDCMADAELKHFSTEFVATWKSLQRYNCPQWFRWEGHTGGLSVLDEFADRNYLRVD